MKAHTSRTYFQNIRDPEGNQWSRLYSTFDLLGIVQKTFYDLGPSINDVGNLEGGGVKNWSKLPTDCTKKLALPVIMVLILYESSHQS